SLMRSESAQEVSDDEAVRHYLDEYDELAEELDEAKRNNDEAKAEKLQHELHALLQALQESQGLGSRKRGLGPQGPAPAACRAVSAAIKRASKALEKSGLPSLAQHIRSTIRTSSPHFFYSPQSDVTCPSPDWKV